MKPTILLIAGIDPSGGSGLIADIRTASAFAVDPMCVITATTAQGRSRFIDPGTVNHERIKQQLNCLQEDAPRPSAIKIGMLGSVDCAEQIANHLEHILSDVFTVIDPVLVTSTGGVLANSDLIACYRQRLLPRANLFTPNVPEAREILQQPISTLLEMKHAAAALLECGAKAVLLKGGHLSPQEAIRSQASGYRLMIDHYSDREGRAFWIASPAVDREARGTGCSLASAIAAAVATGQEVLDAIVMGRSYIQRGLTRAGSEILQHGPWPVQGHDFPTIGINLEELMEKFCFPTTGPRPLGFYPIVDRAAWLPRLAKQGVDLLQLRIKDLSGEALKQEIAQACKDARALKIRLFVNDFWQLALECGAYGVHLGQEDLNNADIASIAAGGLRLGISTHSYAELARAKALNPSYIALGPIHETTCKSLRFGPQGLARIREWRALSGPIPLVAIGGLRLSDATSLTTVGADGVAVISDWLASADPDHRVKQWVEALL